jgi:hypothetical protein
MKLRLFALLCLILTLAAVGVAMRLATYMRCEALKPDLRVARTQIEDGREVCFYNDGTRRVLE